MLYFDFTKSGLEIKEEHISPFKDRIKKVINELERGRNEFVFSTLIDSTSELQNIKKIANSIRRKFDTLLVVGIGGSSLGAKTLIDGLATGKKDRCRILFLENIDSESINYLLKDIDPENTALNFISRSGTTLETVTHYLILKDYFKKKLKKDFGKNFFVTTADKTSFLGKEASKSNYTLIKIPAELVGRYSVLSPVGLLPAAVAGLNINKIIDGARTTKKNCTIIDLEKNPAVIFALTVYNHYLRGKKNIVIMPYRDALERFNEWFAQLWAESLGKISADGTVHGQTPLKAIGTNDQHSQLQLYLEGPDDKIIIFITAGTKHDIKIKNADVEFSYLNNKYISEIFSAEQKATADALFSKGRPSICIHLENLNEVTMGGLIYFFEVVTVLMAAFLNVNPFNQPAVEEIKRRAKGILSI